MQLNKRPRMDSDWEYNTANVRKNSSLYIPINVEAKKEYDEWVEKDCESLWWWKKEQKRKERLEIPCELSDRELQEFK